MKKLLLIFAVVLFTAGFATKVSAQLVTEINQAGGEIVSPIKLTKVHPLEFGRLAAAAAGGSVVLTASSTPTVTPSGSGVTLVASVVTRSAASFNVTGATGFFYTIGLPQSPITLTGSLSGTMTVTSFNSLSSNGSTTGGLLIGEGTDVFYVGGTLNIGTSQPAGLYSGPFSVTVIYN